MDSSGTPTSGGVLIAPLWLGLCLAPALVLGELTSDYSIGVLEDPGGPQGCTCEQCIAWEERIDQMQFD